MRVKNWSQLTLITVCSIVFNLLSPVISVYTLDLDDLSESDKSSKSSSPNEKLFDDIDDQLDADLMPPNFQPDPLLPIDDDDIYEEIGQLSKHRAVQLNGDDPNDPFNRYIGNVFDSLPEAKTIFDALRLNEGLRPESDEDLAAISSELLIPILMGVSADGKKTEPATIKMTRILTESRHGNKSEKADSKGKSSGKLIEALYPVKDSTTVSSKATSGSKGSTTIKPSQGVAIDEVDDQLYDDEEESNKSTTKGKFNTFDNPLYKWWSSHKSTTPENDDKIEGKTTTSRPKTTDDDDNNEDDEDSITTTTTKSTKSSTTTTAPSTTHSGHGKDKTTSTTTKSQKSSKNSTESSSTTDHSTESDSDSTSGDKPSTSTTKHSKSTSTSTHKPTSKSTKPDKDEDEDENEDLIGQLIFEEKKSRSSKTTPAPTTKSDEKHSSKHEKTTSKPASTTTDDDDDNDEDKPTTKSSSTKKPTTSASSNSTTHESETTAKPTTSSEDTFPVISVTKSKSKSETKTTTKATTVKPTLTVQGRKTTRHPSTTPSEHKSATTTAIPALHPYVEDSDSEEDEMFLSNWNPDLFP